MEAPPGMTGRFFVAVEPYEPERRALKIWLKELLRTTSETSWTRSPCEAGATERSARRPPPRKWGTLVPEGAQSDGR
jgi:hypothetical protein